MFVMMLAFWSFCLFVFVCMEARFKKKHPNLFTSEVTPREQREYCALNKGFVLLNFLFLGMLALLIGFIDENFKDAISYVCIALGLVCVGYIWFRLRKDS